MTWDYGGYVTSSCDLTDDELKWYASDCVITQIQFSSSKKGSKVASGGFANRNTFFQIYSLTGRPIQQFSNFPEEDEVLVLPHSTLIIFIYNLSFLRSPFAQRLRNADTFRIVTDLNRENENPSHNAGVRLLSTYDK
ncbi:unnamed protein product [Didymodactylos carnosus]|uniref:NAD(P)(+)--arginine ADP-ribosyltransferase n=1 Tax=Didymodactylos carnosus TaxID=1234261 RepID=A0A8S2E3K4_9BILA|nr:unnamed protein product [Didymodactylos carnosus]CAF3901491.1 unnamed protein product [Didymodactylos carnosus]